MSCDHYTVCYANKEEAFVRKGGSIIPQINWTSWSYRLGYVSWAPREAVAINKLKIRIEKPYFPIPYLYLRGKKLCDIVSFKILSYKLMYRYRPYHSSCRDTDEFDRTATWGTGILGGNSNRKERSTHPSDPSQDGFAEAEETTAASNHQRCSGCSGLSVRTDRMKSVDSDEYYLEIENKNNNLHNRWLRRKVGGSDVLLFVEYGGNYNRPYSIRLIPSSHPTFPQTIHYNRYFSVGIDFSLWDYWKPDQCKSHVLCHEMPS